MPSAPTAAQTSLLASFAPSAREPAWLAEARRAALARFEALGLPTARHEDWRFTSLAALGAVAFGRAPAGDAAFAASLLARGTAPEGPRLVFVNGRLDPVLSKRGGLRSGVILGTLAEALRDVPEKVRPHLGRLARPDDQAFVAANTALFEDGAFVFLPRGADLGPPIALVFVTDGAPSPAPLRGAEEIRGRAPSPAPLRGAEEIRGRAPSPAPLRGAEEIRGRAAGPAAVHPRVLVVAEEGARGTVEEVFVGRGASLTNAVTELVLADGAALEHVRIQSEADEAFHVGSVHAEQGAESSLAAHAFALGARLSRSEIRARLAGEGARIAANGLYMADGARVADHFSWVEHAVPRCTTTETFKGILDGSARGVFSGRVRVLPGAQKTVAHQTSSSLLLSDDAVADAKPQLEIFADDVKCGHGGTVGQLDEAALFYLRSRGVPEADAKSLLIWAFASEMVGLVAAPALRARAKNLVAARLPAGARVLEAA